MLLLDDAGFQFVRTCLKYANMIMFKGVEDNALSGSFDALVTSWKLTDDTSTPGITWKMLSAIV